MGNYKKIFKTDLKLETDEEYISFFEEEVVRYGFSLTREIILEIFSFIEFLLEENEKYNLTSILKFEDILYKHIIDSLLLLKTVDLNKNLLDIGAGAGFPSTPIAIVKKDLEILQLDSSKKRVDFLNMVNNRLFLNVESVHERAEVLAKNENYREKFKIVVARAVAKLNILAELCLPFVEIGGFFVALKGPEYKNDLDLAENSIKKLGGCLEKVKGFKIEDNSRNMVVIKKISHSSTKYPRSFSKISKNPL